MTNAQIIADECALRGITEPVHTYAVWRSKGFQVKKGETAAFKTSLWKFVKKENKDETENEDSSSGNMYLTTAALFKQSQVEKIETEEG